MAEIRCPRCGVRFSDAIANRCPGCSLSTDDIEHCIECGTPVFEMSKPCPGCGCDRPGEGGAAPGPLPPAPSLLTEGDRRRIEEEEKYRAEVRVRAEAEARRKLDAQRRGGSAPPRRAPPVLPMRCDPGRVAAAGRDYTGWAWLSLVLYLFCGYIPGLITNLIALFSAMGDHRRSGVAPAGKGCLVFLIWVYFILPVLVSAALFFAAGGSMVPLMDWVERFLHHF